jgi:hypothetical protein
MYFGVLNTLLPLASTNICLAICEYLWMPVEIRDAPQPPAI